MLKIIVLSLSLVSFVFADSLVSKNAGLNKALVLFHKAQRGVEDDVLKALENFKEIQNSSTKNAYVGSLTTMLARHTYLPWKKLSYVKEGSKLLDNSIRIEPNSIDIRLTRFYTYLNMPDFLKKEPFLQEDVRSLLKFFKSGKNPKMVNNQLLEAIVQFFHKYENSKKRDVYLNQITDEKIKQKLLLKING